MSTAIVALPTSSDRSQWTSEEAALVEAAGLVRVERNGEKTLAPRPVVAAFLQHVQRTGLDPIARQIYCIARKSRGQVRWQTQISIDGARLVAERSGQYRGQTPTEWTADGVTWVQVWLSKEMPRAARVGVYREGFAEPLFTVATWDSYAVYEDVWENGHKTGEQKLSAMWAKFGPLMLGKCAEMLALRKAFPMELSGLYSAEEMDQASPQEPSKTATTTGEHEAPPVAPPEWLEQARQMTFLGPNRLDGKGLRGLYKRAADTKVEWGGRQIAVTAMRAVDTDDSPTVASVLAGLAKELPEEAPTEENTGDGAEDATGESQPAIVDVEPETNPETGEVMYSEPAK